MGTTTTTDDPNNNNTTTTTTTTTTKSDHSILPALYKVINANGANIIESRTKRTLILRNVPIHKIIICTHVQKWKKLDDDDFVTMLCMPDGWVNENDVQCMNSIPLPIVNKKGIERDIL